MKERTPQMRRIDERSFPIVRKGYDLHEVSRYLEELEHAFQDIEGHVRRTSQRVVELERDLAAARATEKASLDNAMLAVFDVKDRMLDRAERRAREIQDEAGKAASSLFAKAEAARGREPELEHRISGLEQELVRSRADSERLRVQLEDAHALIDQLETTATVDITTLQSELVHERQKNEELLAAAREIDYVRRDYEEKLARAQQTTMYARAELEVLRAHIEAQPGSIPTGSPVGTVVYERHTDIDDLEMLAAAADEDRVGRAV
jgi:cell division septum initiation protein DivIVA